MKKLIAVTACGCALVVTAAGCHENPGPTADPDTADVPAHVLALQAAIEEGRMTTTSHYGGVPDPRTAHGASTVRAMARSAPPELFGAVMSDADADLLLTLMRKRRDAHPECAVDGRADMERRTYSGEYQPDVPEHCGLPYYTTLPKSGMGW